MISEMVMRVYSSEMGPRGGEGGRLDWWLLWLGVEVPGEVVVLFLMEVEEEEGGRLPPLTRVAWMPRWRGEDLFGTRI